MKCSDDPWNSVEPSSKALTKTVTLGIYSPMDDTEAINWIGAGRWLMIGLGGLLVLFAVPLVFSRDHGAAAGWDLFLGLLAIGAVVSGNRRAPQLAFALAILMIVRLAAAVFLRGGGWAIGVSLAFAVIAGVAAHDLRRQALAG